MFVASLRQIEYNEILLVTNHPKTGFSTPYENVLVALNPVIASPELACPEPVEGSRAWPFDKLMTGNLVFCGGTRHRFTTMAGTEARPTYDEE
jgi:hypothetical protein